jgi:hypothetical protein
MKCFVKKAGRWNEKQQRIVADTAAAIVVPRSCGTVLITSQTFAF